MFTHSLCGSSRLFRAPRAPVTIFGLCVGADTVLLNHEASQRSEENYIRNRARTELGRQGIVASETEIMKWRDSFMRQREEQRAQQENKA